MFLPLQPVFDVQFFEYVHHVGIGTEEDVESGFVPISVLVLPCCYLQMVIVERVSWVVGGSALLLKREREREKEKQ